MKRSLLTLTLTFSTLSGLAAAQGAASPPLPTKLAYLVSSSASPDGKYTLAAYEEKIQHGQGEDRWESDVGFYIGRMNGDKLEIVSDRVFDREGTEPDNDNGPAVLTWSRDRGPDDARVSKYVVVNDQWRKHNDLRFLRLVNGKYVKQVYTEEKYAKEEQAVLQAAVKQLGLGKEYRLAHSTSNTDLAFEPPTKPNEDFEVIGDEVLKSGLDFSKPFYVVHTATYDTNNEDENADYYTFNVLSVVKIEKDEQGNLKDTKVLIKAEGLK